MRRASIHEPTNLGDYVADRVTERLGSWTFIIVQSVFLALWLLLNSVGWFYHWDAAPFILLNLCLSFQAAFTGPIVLLSQNRQAQRDHQRDDIEASEVEMLLKINQEQLAILTEQRREYQELRGLLVRIALQQEYNDQRQSERA
jgi:uncharacterized membrane protein